MRRKGSTLSIEVCDQGEWHLVEDIFRLEEGDIVRLLDVKGEPVKDDAGGEIFQMLQPVGVSVMPMINTVAGSA